MTTSVKLITHPAAWTPETLFQREQDWVYTLGDDDIAELDAAWQSAKAAGLVVPRFGKEAFPLPRLMAKLAPYQHQLDAGLGLLQIKGFPVDRYSKDAASLIFWGLGMHFGAPWAQNNRGHLLGDVINEGKSLDDPSARGYQTTATLNMHTDGADLVALLFLKQADVGGESTVVSALSIYNLLAQRNPEALAILVSKSWCIDWRNEQKEGDLPYHRGPLFTDVNGQVSCFALTPYVRSAQRFPEVPRLTAEEIAALDAFDAASEDPSLLVTFKQEAGDIFFLNNHFHAHGRSSFVDADDLNERRHLRRLWLQSSAWDSHRPLIMQNILDMSRHWEVEHPTVQMWDKP